VVVKIASGILAGALIAMAWHGSARAGTVDLGVGGHSVRGSVGVRLPPPNMELDVGWLHNDDGRDVASVGVHFAETLGKLGIEAAIGARGYYADAVDADGGAVALGGRVAVPIRPVPRLWVGGDVYFAPNASSFGDLDKFYEVGAAVEYRVLSRAGLYAGVRRLRADLDAGSVTVDDDVHFGIRFRF